MRGHEGDHIMRECLVREGPKDKNSKVHYTFYDIIEFIRQSSSGTPHKNSQTPSNHYHAYKIVRLLAFQLLRNYIGCDSEGFL